MSLVFSFIVSPFQTEGDPSGPSANWLLVHITENVQTFTAQGINVVEPKYYCFWAQPDTDDKIVEAFSAALAEIQDDAGLQEVLASYYAGVGYMNPAGFYTADVYTGLFNHLFDAVVGVGVGHSGDADLLTGVAGIDHILHTGKTGGLGGIDAQGIV